jgi:hypothetical protein
MREDRLIVDSGLPGMLCMTAICPPLGPSSIHPRLLRANELGKACLSLS